MAIECLVNIPEKEQLIETTKKMTKNGRNIPTIMVFIVTNLLKIVFIIIEIGYLNNNLQKVIPNTKTGILNPGTYLIRILMKSRLNSAAFIYYLIKLLSLIAPLIFWDEL